MGKLKSIRDIITAGFLLVILFVCASGLWAESSPAGSQGSPVGSQGSARPTDDEVLKMVPAESLFCIRVNNFEYTVHTIDQFLTGVSPTPMAASVLVRTQFAKVLGSPELKGVNMNGSFAIFGMTVPGGKQAEAGEQTKTNPASNIFIGGLVPVTDYKQFISDNPNCGQPDETAVSKITVDEKTAILVTQVGNYALISLPDNHDKLVATAKIISAAKTTGLSNALDDNEAKLAATEPLWIYGNVQQAAKTFAPLVFGQLEKAKTAIEKAKSSGQKMMIEPSAVISMYASILETIMKETKCVSLTVRPKANVCNLIASITAMPGTDMANMFVADATAEQDNKLLVYLKDGAMMNFGFKINSPLWKKLYIKSIDMIAAMAGESITAEDITKWKALVVNAIDCLGGPIAFSFSVDAKNRPPFVGQYIIEVKDTDKFNKIIKEASEMMNTRGIADFYKNFGMEMSFTTMQGVDRYKDVSIDSAKLAMKSTEPNSPQGQMIKAMYGDGFDYRWGTVGGLFVCAVGGDVNSAIREIIDEVKSDSPKQMGGEMRTALTLLPETGKSDFVGTYNFLRWLKIMTAFAPVPMSQIDTPTKSNIAFAAKAGSGRMVVDIAVPKEHLTEIMTASAVMQQQMMQQQMKEMPMPAEPTKPQSWWTCPMHPQIRMLQKGECPICGMNLIPLKTPSE